MLRETKLIREVTKIKQNLEHQNQTKMLFGEG